MAKKQKGRPKVESTKIPRAERVRTIRVDIDLELNELIDQAVALRRETKASWIRGLIIDELKRLRLLEERKPGRP